MDGNGSSLDPSAHDHTKLIQDCDSEASLVTNSSSEGDSEGKCMIRDGLSLENWSHPKLVRADQIFL